MVQDASVRRRIIYDSVSITATATGDQAFFTASGTKTKIQMHPLLDGRVPNGQRFNVDGIAVALGTGANEGDSIYADGAVVTLNVDDAKGQRQKMRGHPRNFPAGGGAYGMLAQRTNGATDGQTDVINNGLPTPEAIYVLNPAIVLDPGVSFDVQINIPTALTGLTTLRWYVYLYGLWEFFLKQVPARA